MKSVDLVRLDFGSTPKEAPKAKQAPAHSADPLPSWIVDVSSIMMLFDADVAPGFIEIFPTNGLPLARHLYAGCRSVPKQVSPGLIPRSSNYRGVTSSLSFLHVRWFP